MASSRKALPSLSGTSFVRTAAALAIALVLLALPGSAAAANSAELKRYPYLTDSSGPLPRSTGQRPDCPNGALKYGKVGTESCTAHTVTGTRTAITVGAVSEYQWKARLTVDPNTDYCYRIYFGASSQIDLLGDDPAPTFKSALPAGTTAPFSFAVFGDWGSVEADGTNANQANVIGQLAASGSRFGVTTGDNAYPAGLQTNYGDLVQTGAGTSAAFGPSFWKVAGSSLALFPTMGNHGFTSAGAMAHLTNWPQDSAVAGSNGTHTRETSCCVNGTTSGEYPSIWYAFDVGNARFYILEAAWTDTNNGSSDRLEGLLSRAGVNIAFSGHTHIYQRNKKPRAGSLINYVTGGGGAEVASVGEAGCSAFDAYAIGWSSSMNVGTACGSAPRPTSIAQVVHFLKVTVNGMNVTVTPTDSLGRTFDVVTYDFAPTGNLKCDGSYTGVTLKSVVVPKGGFCTLTNSSVTDNVKVQEGATFIARGTSVRKDVTSDRAAKVDVAGSTVGGNFQNDRTVEVNVTSSTVTAGDLKAREAASVAICATTVKQGVIQVEKVKGSVRVGDPDSCGGNVVERRDMLIRENVISGQLRVRTNNILLGNLEVSKNTGSGDKLVEGNTGTRDLRCKENTPPFSASGNTGSTKREGQCL